MALKGKNNEEKIWNYLKDKGLNDYGVAGLMGNLYSESALNPKNLQNTYEKKLSMSDDEYTKAVDKGSYDNFVKDNAGYGLAQWTYWTRKRNLLEFAESKKKSIGDLEMQLDFLYQELSKSYSAVLKTLKNATSVREASDAVLLKFEKPKNQSESVQEKRASYGEGYYDKYHVEPQVEKIAKKVKDKVEKTVPLAKDFSSAIYGNYRTTANLRLRKGAGTDQALVCVIPDGSMVSANGFYKVVDGVKWYMVSYGKDSGFCSSQYLRRT